MNKKIKTNYIDITNDNIKELTKAAEELAEALNVSTGRISTFEERLNAVKAFFPFSIVIEQDEEKKTTTELSWEKTNPPSKVIPFCLYITYKENSKITNKARLMVLPLKLRLIYLQYLNKFTSEFTKYVHDQAQNLKDS